MAASSPIPFPRADAPAQHDAGLTDHELGEMINRAVANIQAAMDKAMSAGIVLEPSFSMIENRIAPSGMRHDSFVCKVRSFRRLS